MLIDLNVLFLFVCLGKALKDNPAIFIKLTYNLHTAFTCRIEVIHEDEDVVVIDKPSSIPVFIIIILIVFSYVHMLYFR